jgi:anthranilate phosphoribosyltransferase
LTLFWSCSKILLENSNNKDFLKKSIEKSGICILHAPLFHPAMKNVAPIRKELGLKTFFNILGRLVNPTKKKNQIVGVFNLELARLYSYLFQKTNKNYAIIHSLDGYDEISLTGPAKAIRNQTEQMLSAQDFGVKEHTQAAITGGDSIEASAKIFVNVLSGKGTEAQNNVVWANAGMAIATVKELTPIEGFELAKESLLSGKGMEAFKKLKDLTI